MKISIDFTPQEKRKLWRAGVSLKRLDNCTLRQISDAIGADKGREEQIRRQFHKSLGPDGLEKVLDLRHLAGAASLLRSNPLINNPSYRAANAISDRYDRLIPKGLLPAMDMISRTQGGLDKLAGTYRLSERLLGNGVFSVKSAMEGFLPISERLQNASRGLDRLNMIQGNTRLLQTELFWKSDTLMGLGRTMEQTASVSQSLLHNKSFVSLNLGGLARAIADNSGFERNLLPGIGAGLFAASSLTRMAEANLGAFQWSSLGNRLHAPTENIGTLRDAFINVSERYGNLLGNIAYKPNWVYEAPGAVQVASEDFYIGSQVLKIVSDEDAPTTESRNLDLEIDEKNNDAIKRYLPVIDKDLPDLWMGAVQAMNSDNPDKVRHMITSLRELYTHVLHRLAPNEEIEKWDLDRKHYNEGKPTRRGRFMYICRNLDGSQNQFAKLLKAEVDTTIAMIDLFQGGTHNIKSVFDESELLFIKIKAETTLRTFLSVEFEINRKN